MTIAPGIYEDMDEPTYLGDKSSLSSSGAKRLLRSPADFLLPQWFSDAADLGSAFHTETLGVGQEVVVVDAATWRGKEAKAAQDEARATGKAPILAKDVDTVRAMAEAVRAHPTASQLLEQPGKPELSVFWEDDQHGINRRARFDRYLDSGVIVDLKSTTDVTAKAIQRTTVNYGYDLSVAWYIDTALGLGLDVTAFALVFVEKTPPFKVRVVELAQDFIDRGRRLADRAIATYLECVESGEWPHYDDPGFTTIHPPAWARED